MRFYSCILFLFMYIILVNANEFKLSDSKVLLPRTSFLSINYTIKGSPTICHEWISETPEVVAITPLYNSDESKCSYRAIITSVWQSNTKATGTVHAKNMATGHSVKCDVIIDQIKKLEIETRTLELYLHETPEALIARAYDEYGNTFSTLDGIPFEWQIHTNGSNGDAQNVLRFITWTESEYSTPPLIGTLEQQGLQGYMQLVSGLKTGAAKVSLFFRDDKIKNYINSQDVRLLVMANAALSPSLAYLIPHTQLSYKIIVHSQGSTQEVKMPNNQYYLKISNADIAELDVKGSTITAKKYGQTEVTLIDRNINEDFRHPSSLLYVVEPGFLTFHISPHENQWVLQTEIDNIYTITVRPYDYNSHPIFMSDNIRLETTIPKEYFEILHSSANGTYNVVKAIKVGKTSLKSKLMFILLPNRTELKLETPVEGTQELIIFPPIKVIPNNVILPWYPDEKLVSGYLLTATGGSGEYKWMVYDNNIKANNSITVDLKGYVKPLKPGLSKVIAADQLNLNNRGYSNITVEIIRLIQFLLDRVEVEVGKEIDLPIIASDHKNFKMSACHWLPFQALSEDSLNIEIVQILSSQNSQISDSCALLRVRGIKPGFSKVTLSLESFSYNGSPKELLTTSITTGAFIPTTFVDPNSGSSTIGVRSFRTMNIVHGPLPWILDPSNYYFEMLENSDLKRIVSKISLTESRSSSKVGGLSLKVQCLSIGEVNISVVIGNKPSLKNPNPVKSVGVVKLICTLPIRMILVPKLMVSNISSDCPFSNSSERQHITINNKIPPSVEVIFTDKHGLQLERSESFVVKVEIKSLSKKNIRDIVQDVYPKIYYEPDSYETSVIRTKFYVKPFRLGISVGEIDVIAKSNSCHDLKCPTFNLEARVQMQISKSIIVEPERILLYQHLKVVGKFSVKFGSGYFMLHANVDFLQINKLKKSELYKDETFYEVIQTRVDSSQRNGIIYVVDACFHSIEAESENSKSITVELVKPFKLQMFSMNRVQLGSQIDVLLKVYDDMDREFPQDALHMLDLTLHFNDNNNVISAHSLLSKEWFVAPNEYSDSAGFIFKINGEKLGFSSLFVKLNQNSDIISNILKVEVFPPLKLIPKYTVLLEGAEVQLSSSGGPQNCHDLLHYSIMKNNTVKSKEAAVEFITGPNGLVKAIRHGEISVAVSVEVSDNDPARNNRLTVLSKDEGRIGVVQIKSLSIWSPTKSLLVGNAMPLWVTFTSSSNDLQHIPITGFSITGLENSDISFKWQLNPPHGVISKLENILEPAGININNKYLHSGMRLSALNPGKQTVEVSVSGIPKQWLSKDIKSNVPLISKLNAAIISKLEIIHPISLARTILVPPSTRINLKSSLDDVASVTYTLIPYRTEKVGSETKSKIHSGSILETNPSLSGNEVERFILHVTSSQSIKLNTANEVMANQTIALFFTVKHPTYSMLSPFISPDSLFKKFQNTKILNQYSNIFVLPLGGPFEFRITNHDELGSVFDISPDTNMFSYRIHRTDNIAITISSSDSMKKSITVKDKLTLNVDPILKYIDDTSSFSSQKVLQFQGLGTGDNTIQLFYHDLFSDSQQMIDIVSIPSGSVLSMKNYPLNYAVECSYIKYEAPFENGYWYSSDRDVIMIDSLSGEAILKKRGSSNIFYSLSNSYSNTDKLSNKNVLISKELSVHSASQVSMKIFDGASIYSEDPCSKTECIPINFNQQWNSLIAAVYIFSPIMSDYQSDTNFKFEREHHLLNLSQQLQSEVPLECHMDISVKGNSISNLQDTYKSILKVNAVSIRTEIDDQNGIKQWGCYIVPNSIGALTHDELLHFVSVIRSDVELKIQARLRHSSIKSTSISIPIIFGYVLLMSNDNRSNLTIKESGEVITAIRMALPMGTKNLLEKNKNIKLSVSSNRPNLLEVLAPREDGIDSGKWIYPLKASVDKIINEKVEITIEFPLTKQRDVINVQMDIRGKSSVPNMLSAGGDDINDVESSSINWLAPVIGVLITASIAIGLVMLVNYFIQPKVNEDQNIPSPTKDTSWSRTGNAFPYSPLHGSPYTHHVWNSQGPRRDNSPPFNTTHNRRYPVNPNLSSFQEFK